jgi:hypothetical protein
MSDHRSGHDAECESELTSHGYTPCRCHERAGICYCRKSPCICAPSPALAGAQATGTVHPSHDMGVTHRKCIRCYVTLPANLAEPCRYARLSDDDRRAAFMALVAKWRNESLPSTRKGEISAAVFALCARELEALLAQRPEAQPLAESCATCRFWKLISGEAGKCALGIQGPSGAIGATFHCVMHKPASQPLAAIDHAQDGDAS